MIQIITDDHTQKITLNCKDIQLLSNNEQNSPVNKEKNVINLAYINNNESANKTSNKTTIAKILFDKEKYYTKRLLIEKNIGKASVKMTNGAKNDLSVVSFKNENTEEKKFVSGFKNFISTKNEYKLYFRFNDKLDINIGGKFVNFDEFQKMFGLNKIKMEFEFKFYSVVYKTQEKTNVVNRLKLLSVKILEMSGNSEILNEYKNIDSFYDKKKYTTTKKTAVNNIMQLLTK